MRVICAFVFYFIVGWLFNPLNAQMTATEIFGKVGQLYQSAKTLSFSITYTYFENANSTNPIKVSKGSVKMIGPNYYVSLDKMQMLRNDTFLIVTDNENRVLMIDSCSAAIPGNFNTGISIDTLVKYMGQVSVSEGASKYVLTITNKENTETLVKKTEISINKTTFIIEKMVVYYKTIYDNQGSTKSWNPKMTVDYSNVKVNAPIEAGLFYQSRFIKKSGKKLLPIASFKSYELINNLE